jgi:glycosyltransferase involved in cell wall biosynthesis
MITMLMSVYAGENPEFLAEAFRSIESQDVLPDEFILVKDGPLGDLLDRVVTIYEERLGLHVIDLAVNVGLAEALNVGLRKARNPWIMRFDSDDFCCPERILRQKEIIELDVFDLFGAQIEEFNFSHEIAVRSRRVPVFHKDIVAFAQKRNPFNHMTVCYRKELALKCGGYPKIAYMEDYALWVKMLAAGALVMNSDKTLVRARIGNGMINRRGGLKCVLSEIRMQRLMVDLRFKSFFGAMLDGCLRSFVFLMPVTFRSLIYSLFLRRR